MDTLSPVQRHRCMSSIHSASTKPELTLRKNLWKHGFRYIINDKRLPGKPDLVLPKYRTVIFVHGCFWHGHKGCKTSHIPDSNKEFWSTKIIHNQERDQEVWRLLEGKGWSVIIVWECQLKKGVLDETLARVEAEIRRNQMVFQQIQQERQIARELYRQEQKGRKEREAALKAEIIKKTSPTPSISPILSLSLSYETD